MVETITDLCVVTAVDIEFKIAADLLSGKSFSEESRVKVCRGVFGARRIVVLQSEMGAVGFAERLAQHLAENRYDALIVAGLAGGLDPKLRAGDAVLYNSCYDTRAIDPERLRQSVSEQPPIIACDDMLSDFLFDSATAAGLRCVRGAGVTVSRIVTEAKSKLALGSRYGAVAVDMETYEALSACARLNLPAAALRVISDEAARDIPDLNRAYDADGRTNGWQMAGAMIARPAATLHFLPSVRRALRSLKENLRAALNA